MRIYLNEITDQEAELTFTESEPWVRSAVERVDEVSDAPKASSNASRPTRVEMRLRKVDDVIVLSGQASSQIDLLCSRCACPFALHVTPKFSALFCRDPVMAGVGHLETAGKPAGQNAGFARHAHDFAGDAAREASGGDPTQDLDITYLAEDYIELGDVLTEQLRLEVPFQPLCSESCKGICPQCGTDLNQGRCACAAIAKRNAFSALKNFKVETSTH